MNEYENLRRVTYGEAQFVPVCEKCGRFVKAYEKLNILVEGGGAVPGPTANCKKCGPTTMPFEGYF